MDTKISNIVTGWGFGGGPLKPVIYKSSCILALIMLLMGFIPLSHAACSLAKILKPATITFSNASRQSVEVINVSSNCTEQPGVTLKAGQSITLKSATHQVWRVRKSSNRELLTETDIVSSKVSVTISNAMVLGVSPLVPPDTPLSAPSGTALAPGLVNSGSRAVAPSPRNTPFVEPLPILPVMTPVAEVNRNPAPTLGTNPLPTATGRVVQAKSGTAVVASASIGGFTEAQRPDHQKWTEFGGTSSTLPGFKGDFYETVEMEVPWNFYPAVDRVPASNIWTLVEASTGRFGMLRINARYGTPVVHRIHNALPAQNGGFGINQTSIHLHNGHTASESDGGPTHFYDAGQFKDYHYANVRAGFASDFPTSSFNGVTVKGDYRETLSTLWYHDHRMDFTAQNAYKGLVGWYTLFSDDILLDTGNENTGLRLPSGEYDIPLTFVDRRFDPVTGQLAFDTENIDGFLGDKFTVNGKIQPYLNVARRKYRFRMLNGSSARYYDFSLSNNAAFVQLSTDGNMLPQPVVTNKLRSAPGDRFDVILDFSTVPAGTRIYVQNTLEQLDGRGPTGKTVAPTRLLELRVQGTQVADNSRIPTAMLPLPDKNVPVTGERSFVFGTQNGAWVVNGEFFDPNTITTFIKQNSTERWTFGSGGGWSHPVHNHVEEFQVLSLDGVPVKNDQVGRLDILSIGKGSVGRNNVGSAEVIIKIRDWLGDYPIHCHNALHEDHAMMTRFLVVP